MSSQTPLLHDHHGKSDLHQALIERITRELTSGIAKNGKASMVVSGGSTPKALFEKLSHVDLPWEKVTISLVDERWVAPESSDSNEYLVKTHLLRDKASDASFIGLKNSALTAKDGVIQCLQDISVLSQPFDVVLLGMGDDGHTASFFPDATALDEALNTDAACIAITPPIAPYERMTLSRKRLLDTRSLLLHIEGEKKYEVYLEAMKDGEVNTMPIRTMIDQQTLPLEVYYTKG